MNSSVMVFDFPVRDGKTLRNYHFILPKFHFILPNFYFAPPWRILVSSLAVSKYLGRVPNHRECKSTQSPTVSLRSGVWGRHPSVLVLGSS